MSDTRSRLALLSLTALGVVYGDIGTSPLYAFKETFAPRYGLAATELNVYGILSLIVWALTLVVAVKYLVFILRADNRGEGGTFALLALVLHRPGGVEGPRRRAILIALALFGAALLTGEGVITPAISVLGAMEGLTVAAPGFDHWIVPVTVVILIVLFAVQRGGTGRIGVFFGPVVLVWFVTIAVLGIHEIALEPRIFHALNPYYGAVFFVEHSSLAIVVLGVVVLAVTGAEALYADMGHFGRKPIQLAWFAIVMPALLLNYLGQGALVLRDPTAAANPFFLLAPAWFRYPLIGIATAAAVVASQALISGAFSLTRQCMQLGYAPRVTIVHTSERETGQIYIPEVNKTLMVGSILLVIAFGSVSALSAAYGLAVTGTMTISTILFATIARTRWRWSFWSIAVFLAVFLTIDLAFFGANLAKIDDGGWVPLAMGLVLFTLMTTWKAGRTALAGILRASSMPLDMFLDSLARKAPPRVPGTAVFMTSQPEGTPVVLLHHLKHNKALHEQVILLSITTADVPRVPDAERLEVVALGHGMHRLEASYGFMETPDVPQLMELARARGLHTVKMETSYFLGRERLLPSGRTRMMRWRKKLFILMARNARSATEFFGLPPNRVVELGAQIEL